MQKLTSLETHFIQMTDFLYGVTVTSKELLANISLSYAKRKQYNSERDIDYVHNLYVTCISKVYPHMSNTFQIVHFNELPLIELMLIQNKSTDYIRDFISKFNIHTTTPRILELIMNILCSNIDVELIASLGLDSATTQFYVEEECSIHKLESLRILKSSLGYVLRDFVLYSPTFKIDELIIHTREMRGSICEDMLTHK